MKTKSVFRPFYPAMINRIEAWLAVMASEGWTLIEQTGWKFVFIQSTPKETEYFMNTFFDSSKGIWFDYFMAKRQYELKRSKLKSNKLIKSTYDIFEIDLSKKDKNFAIYKHIRNKYYKKHYLGLLILSVILVILNLIAAFIAKGIIWEIIAITMIPVLYFGISLMILIFDCN